ncbi:MAG: hypothetical protein RLZZ399_1357 [Verrucomicrobiota bacterium]
MLLEDGHPRPPALQMALDEVLLRAVSQPLLRVYRWDRPCITIGYFGCMSAARESLGSMEITRRWTGGGSVAHVGDWPYSLLVPAGHPFFNVRPAESYRLIHLALFEVLAREGCHYELADQDCPKRSSACFDNPVRSDLIRNGKKIAGAGQRRSRAGLLHQGSVQIPESEHPSGRTLAERMSRVVEAFSLTPDILKAAEALASDKYANPAWNAARLEKESNP